MEDHCRCRRRLRSPRGNLLSHDQRADDLALRGAGAPLSSVAIAESPPEEALAVQLARKLLDLGKGKIARQLVRRDNPDIPAVITCYQYYWHSMFDRQWLLRTGTRMIAR